MKLEQSFEVDAPLEEVWEALVNVERVAPCLPGAAVTGRNEDGTYNGTFTIKIGPTTASYTGRLEMQDVDETEHTATMHAQGSDKRGQGGATATIVSSLSPANGSTRVQVVTDYHITGRLARFGRGGMIEDISERLLREFAGRLQSSLAGGGGVGSAGAGADEASADEVPTEVHEIVGAEEAEAPPPTDVAAPVEGGGETEPLTPAPAPSPPDDAPAPAAPTELPPPPEPAPAPEAPEPISEFPAPPPVSEPTLSPEAEPAPPPPPPPPAAAAPPPPPPRPPSSVSEPGTSPPRGPAAEPNQPLDAGSMVGSVVLDRVRRNPKPVIAVAGGLLLLRLLRRRR